MSTIRNIKGMKKITNHGSLLMDKHSKIFEDLVNFTNLLLYFLNALLPFLNDGLVKGNLII